MSLHCTMIPDCEKPEELSLQLFGSIKIEEKFKLHLCKTQEERRKFSNVISLLNLKSVDQF